MTIQQPSIKTINQVLSSVENGAFHDDVTKALNEMIGDLADHAHSHGGKPSGELVIKLKFNLDEKIMEIKPEFSVKTPKVSRGRSIFFITPENNLSRQDPSQMKLDLDEARERKFTGVSGSALPTTA